MLYISLYLTNGQQKLSRMEKEVEAHYKILFRWQTDIVVDILEYIAEHLGLWERILMAAGISAEYGTGAAAAWLAFVIGITYLLVKLAIDYYD